MRNNLPLNPIQTLLAIAKIAVFFLLPVISFGYLGFVLPIGFSGYRLVMAGNMLMYIPMLLYAFMLIASFGSIRRYSIILGVLVLICEVVFMSITSVLLQQGDMASLISIILNAIPTDTVLGVEITKDFIINSFAKPGLGWTINLIATVLYICAHFLMNFISGNGNGSYQQGQGSMNAGRQNNGSRAANNRNNPVL